MASAETPGDRLRRLRLRFDLTQAELAERCGWEPKASRVSNYERGDRPIDIEAAKALARALHTTPEHILFGTPPPLAQPPAEDDGLDLPVQLIATDERYAVQHHFRAQVIRVAERLQQMGREQVSTLYAFLLTVGPLGRDEDPPPLTPAPAGGTAPTPPSEPPAPRRRHAKA